MEEMFSQYKIKLVQAKFLNALFSWGTAGVRRNDIFTGVAPYDALVSPFDINICKRHCQAQISIHVSVDC